MDFTIVLPAQAKPFTEMMIVALTVWREASGEAMNAKRAVAWVIRNRVEHPSWYGKDWFSVCTKKAQFTSINPPDHVNDPNLRRWPGPEDPSWKETLQACFDVMAGNFADPTNGATFYHDRSMDAHPPAWAAQYRHVADVGNFRFYLPRRDSQ